MFRLDFRTFRCLAVFSVFSLLPSAALMAQSASPSATPAQAADAPATADTQPEKLKLGTVSEKIVGGGPATQGQDRFITSVQYGPGQHFCGAAYLGGKWVLTAAHCVIGERAQDLTVWVGGHNLKNEGQGARRSVTRIIMHPQYDDNTVANDLALLEIANGVNVEPVSLPSAEVMQASSAPGHLATVSGWGNLSDGGTSPDRLHEVLVPIVSNSTCNQPQSYGGDISDKQICAGLEQGGKDSCQGDSGGPLWVTHGGKPYQVGIVSYGDGCALPDKYGVYTRVQKYLGFIKQHTGIEPGSSGGGGNGGDGGNGGSGGDDGNGGSGGGTGDGGEQCADSSKLCRKLVCSIDSYCCDTEFDAICQQIEAEECSL